MKKTGSYPFEVDPLPRAFYHPSQTKELSKRDKKICLTSADSPTKETLQQVCSPEDLKFLEGSNKLKVHEAPTRENGTSADNSSSTLFNESWPSTDRTTSSGTPEGMTSTPEMSQQMRDWLYGRDAAPTASTLGWFIKRFRNAPPTTRQQRDRAGLPSSGGPSSGSHGDFWWLSPPSGSSTPLTTDTPPQKLTPSPRKSPKSSFKKTRERMPSSLSSPSTVELTDRATSDLQRRAEELLEKSEATIDSASTEPFQPLIRPRKTPTDENRSTPTPDPQPRPRPSDLRKAAAGPRTTYQPRKPLNPDDDILYQWRLSRKMEVAQERAATSGMPVSHGRIPGPGLSRKAPSLGGVPLIRSTGSRLPSSSSPSQPCASSHVPSREALPVAPGTQDTVAAPASTAASLPSTEQLEPNPATSISAHRGTEYPPVATPSAEISRPCSHPLGGNAEGAPQSQRPPVEVLPHMHLSCDIIPCPHHHHGNGHGHSHGNHSRKPCYHGNLIRKTSLCSDVDEVDEEKENIKTKMKRTGEEDKGVSSLKKKSGKDPRLERHEQPGRHEVLGEKTSSAERGREHSQRTMDDRRLARDEEKRRRKGRQDRRQQQASTSTGVLGSVISKVVSEHMRFSSSSDEDARSSTSRDSRQEMTGTTSADSKPTKAANNADVKTLLEESSEDEFPDDEILRVLRHKSQSYRDKLRHIDSLLDQVS